MRRLPLPLLAALGVALVGSLAAPARAGAWTKPEGGGYVKLGSATFLSDHAYDNRGNVVDTAPFLLRAETLYAYLEYGVVDGLTAVGYVPYVISTNQHGSGVSFHTLGMGDAMAGLQLALLAYGPVVLSSRVELKVPLYQGAPSVQGRRTRAVPGFPRTATYFPALGDGQVDLSGFVSLGASLPWLDGFFSAESGYRLRTGAVTDALVVNANGGAFLLGRRLLLLVNASAILTFPSGDEARVFVGKGYWSVGPAFMLYVSDSLAIEVGADLVTRGVNAAGGVQMQLGVSYAF